MSSVLPSQPFSNGVLQAPWTCALEVFRSAYLGFNPTEVFLNAASLTERQTCPHSGSKVSSSAFFTHEPYDMKIGIGSDHAGFEYKEQIRNLLADLGHEVTDFGTNSTQAVDYPLFIRPVAEAVARGDCERGVVLGGSGNGEAIVANRVRGIRCALCWNIESAKLARQHNNANMLSLGQRMMSLETALNIVRAWLDTPFEGGRHRRRIDLIDING